MPQASEELRDKMLCYFGDIRIEGPHQFLIDKGWKEENGFLTGPYETLRDIPQKEWSCVMFLVHEWDFALYHPLDYPKV